MATRNPIVLYIEDDRDARDAMAEALEVLGYTVRVAVDGPSGVAQVERETPDIVLIDLVLPGIDGVEVCRRIRKIVGAEFVPVIILTGRAEVEEKVRALRAGANDVCVKPMTLDELDARIKAFLTLRRREQRLEHETAKYRRFALVDPLTELGNRRAFDADLARAWARAERGKRSLALIFADIDRFKSLNDRFGHPTGDEVLRAVARALESAVRKADEAFRIGGDEFAVIAPDADREGVLVMARRIRDAVALAKVAPATDAAPNAGIAVTLTIGVAVGPDRKIISPASLFEAADRALYEAKGQGRGRISVAKHHPREGSDEVPQVPRRCPG